MTVPQITQMVAECRGEKRTPEDQENIGVNLDPPRMDFLPNEYE